MLNIDFVKLVDEKWQSQIKAIKSKSISIFPYSGNGLIKRVHVISDYRPSVAKCRGSWEVVRSRGSWVGTVGVGKCRG